MKRKIFLKIWAVTMLSAVGNSFLVHAAKGRMNNGFMLTDDLLHRLVLANDRQVAILLQHSKTDELIFSRKTGFDFATLTASYCSRESSYYHSEPVAAQLLILSRLLLKFQSDDGTANFGNLESPPDTAFLLEPLTAAAGLLNEEGAKELDLAQEELKKFLLKSGNSLTIGGVHTPNHRWVICAALAGLNAVYPNAKYTNRIQDWLGEGVFIDGDGHFPERSITYAAVEDSALLTIGRLLNKPSLFAPVKKNLEMIYYYMEPNGELVSTDSRRQDQYMVKNILGYYLFYRYLAIRDNNRLFAGVARLIENMPGFEEEVLDRALFHFMEIPLLQKELPAGIEPPVNFEKFFRSSQLVRIRKGDTSATIFGGVDWPVIIASGRSNSPNIFAFRKGKAILKYLRLSTSFFSMGYFYSNGIKKSGEGYVLQQKLTVPYYQPLARQFRNSKGDYKLSPSIDGRFWNKMDFSNRPVSNVKTLIITVSFAQVNGSHELNFSVTGQAGVNVTIELCFSEEGTLSGVSTAEDGNSFLGDGYGEFRSGADTIRFGPGKLGHKIIKGLEGERYSTHFGSLRTEGKHVYLTGETPFSHRLSFS